ncbi:MAG TPA: LytTR family DNA-binding domain-containing protein [Ohtaekwangia sp.]|uniref:LytR/AlgR family response regulator transcription factor n=1 Tax=Ohtaekwangia sp. TaxID=2066019 RepID=UPI002F94DD69
MKSAAKVWKCIIVDDEPLAREVLARYVERISSLQLVGECSNAIEAMECLQQHDADIVFLDIQMPEIRGTDLIRILKNPPFIIVTTAFQEYALEGYELDIVDYLLKPIKFERFLKSITKVFRLSGDHPNSLNLPIDTATPEPEKEPYLYLRTDRKTLKVLLKDILYVEGMGNYVKVFTAGGTIITKNSMTAMETMLPESSFIRTHRSFIVAKTKVRSFSSETIEIEKHQIPIGKLYKNAVMKELQND